MSKYRTHTCADLTANDIEKKVILSGWVHNHRDHGGVLFIDLRDHFGLTQLVSYQDNESLYDLAHLQKENVIRIEGTVQARSEDTINTNLKTGAVEVVVEKYEIIGPCDPLPFSVFPEDHESEEHRLAYRFLDLRRSKPHQNIIFRSKIAARVREIMTDLGFMEIQTPILTASSPEGARDYLVPSRVHPGKFYALPQAPQQFKQLLMAGGFDKYFQIAPCFRDEDARANRSPGEFYQIDMEMAFVEQDDVFAVIETLFSKLFSEFSDWELDTAPFKRIPYREAMLKYGSDKPDLRNPIIIRDVTESFRDSGFNAFKNVIAKGGVVRALPVKGIGDKSRSFFDNMITFAQSIGSKGLGYIIWTDDGVKSPIAKFLSEDEIDQIRNSCDVESGDVVFFVCAKKKEAERIGGLVRIHLGQELDLLEKNVFRFCWIVDFPMYELDEETGKVEFSHNPFSMPQGGMEALKTMDPLEILAYQYDIVCNGEELSSGAIRNHVPAVTYKAFELAGYDSTVVDEKFGAMIKAFKLGAPPHGGIAPGFDRIVMLLADEPNLREVVAFPMNQKAQDLMMDAPREVSEKQLRELNIQLDLPEEEDEEE